MRFENCLPALCRIRMMISTGRPRLLLHTLHTLHSPWAMQSCFGCGHGVGEAQQRAVTLAAAGASNLPSGGCPFSASFEACLQPKRTGCPPKNKHSPINRAEPASQAKTKCVISPVSWELLAKSVTRQRHPMEVGALIFGFSDLRAHNVLHAKELSADSAPGGHRRDQLRMAPLQNGELALVRLDLAPMHLHLLHRPTQLILKAPSGGLLPQLAPGACFNSRSQKSWSRLCPPCLLVRRVLPGSIPAATSFLGHKGFGPRPPAALAPKPYKA